MTVRLSQADALSKGSLLSKIAIEHSQVGDWSPRMSKLYWGRVVVVIVGIAIVGAGICLLVDERTSFDERIRTNPTLLASVKKQINESQYQLPRRFCFSAVLRSLEKLRKIAPDCEFVSVAFRRPRWRSVFANESGATFVFELIAIRESDGKSINVLGNYLLPDWLPQFLVWARTTLRNTEDCRQIGEATEDIFRTAGLSVPKPSLFTPRPAGRNLWHFEVPGTEVPAPIYELETDEFGKIVRYRRIDIGKR